MVRGGSGPRPRSASVMPRSIQHYEQPCWACSSSHQGASTCNADLRYCRFLSWVCPDEIHAPSNMRCQSHCQLGDLQVRQEVTAHPEVASISSQAVALWNLQPIRRCRSTTGNICKLATGMSASSMKRHMSGMLTTGKLAPVLSQAGTSQAAWKA